MARKIAALCIVFLICALIYIQGTHIREHRLRTERLLYGSPVPALMCNEEKVIVVFNPEAVEYFGMNYKGRPLADMLSPESYEKFNTFFNDSHERFSALGQGNWKITVRRVWVTAFKKDGVPADVIVTVRAMQYNGVIEFYVAMRDPNQNAKQEGPMDIPLKK
jgi:PAS domain-containing protein